MTFRWLPEPEQYARPRRSWFWQWLFHVVLEWAFRVDHDLPPEFRPPPGTLIVSNHLSDSDGPILGSLLCRREGLHMRGVVPFFAMREDLFQRGGLANLLHTCPRPVVRLLRLVSLGWFFAHVRTLPLRRLREFTWHDTLCELVRVGWGSSDPAAVFNARGLAELRGCLKALPARVDAIDPWQMGSMRMTKWGLRRLTLQTLRRLAPEFRAVVASHLRDFARRLDDGQCVYLAPEGHISLDGRFGRIRAGTWLLGRMTSAPLDLLPMTLSYDSLGPGRTRVVVHLGEMLHGLDAGDSRTFACGVRRALVTQRIVTPSHLLAQFLCVRRAPFTTEELAVWLEDAINAAQGGELVMDPVFTRMSAEVLVDERLRWFRHKRLVSRKGDIWHNCWASETPPSCPGTEGMVRHFVNALGDFAPDLARTLSS